MGTVDEAKQALRAEMRALRLALTDRPERSRCIWATVMERDDIREAGRVMVFDSIPGEPDTEPLIELLRQVWRSPLAPQG